MSLPVKGCQSNMGYPTFNGFSFNDNNFITERIVFKGLADRAVVRAKLARREGTKLLNSEFGEKQIELNGVVITQSVGELKTLLDSLKQSIQVEEGDLMLESGRTFKATVESLVIPDEHYNQSKAPWQATFVCSDPFSLGSVLTAVAVVPSGVYTYSGTMSISGTMFNRPTFIFQPLGADAGNTNITSLVLKHISSGQEITVSGFGTGLGLDYSDNVVINFNDFTILEGGAAINQTGAFSKWDPGSNEFVLTANGTFPGGTITVSYAPRYL